MLLTAECVAPSNIFKGTYFIVTTERDYVVAAIDSRVTAFINGSATGTSFRDDVCKLLPLNDFNVFLSEGDFLADGPFGFNAFEIAKAAYGRQVSPLNIQTLTEQWADSMTQAIRNYSLGSSQTFVNRQTADNIVQGFFLGFDAGGNISVFRATVIQQ